MSQQTEDLQAELKRRAADASQEMISKRIKREVDRGHPQKQAAAIAYSQLGETKS